jgi:hypothetical protein
LQIRVLFQIHIEDLNNDFWNGISIEEAIRKTRKDAKLLERELLEIAESGKTERLENLSTFFEPLSEAKIYEYEKDKAKGIIKPSWLRIYAIRIEANLFVISGGAIKLTPTMNETDHLLLELDKLEITRNFLLDDENDNLDFIEIY